MLAYGFERPLRLRRSRLGDGSFGAQVATQARAHGPGHVLTLVRGSATVLARVVRPALERWEAPRASLEKQLEDAGRREARALLASLRPFSVIAVIAPLLGLLGTVVGIILSFLAVSNGGAMGRPEALATGISQALVTTAAGLVIAIPSQALYYWLRGRVDRFVRELEATSEALLALHGMPPSAFAPPAPPLVAAAPATPIGAPPQIPALDPQVAS
jgi:biopolymer transport protein ExbB